VNQVLEEKLRETEGFVRRVVEKEELPFSEVSIESVLLDADLFVKYRSVDKAFNLLNEAIERSPRSIALREKMREIATTHKNVTEAARQCLALVNLYIAREEFDTAYDRLQEAKLLDPRISVAPGLEAIRRARRPEFDQNKERTPVKVRTDCALAGDLSLVGIFDVIQVVENSRMTGILVIKSDVHLANVSFNTGKIVDAEADGFRGEFAFKIIVEINSGGFEFSLSPEDFPVVIQVSSNTNFLLDVLTQLDTERAEKQGMRNLSLEDF
jgi:tetratricopeptide (TPR) repeat protein